MKLMQFIAEIASLAGDPNMEKISVNQILNHINTEVMKLTVVYPKNVQAEFTTTASGYYHSLDFDSIPRMKITELMVNGRGAEKKRWKYMKEATGDAV